MKHDCVMKDENGNVFHLFLDAVIEGSFEYDDFYDAYMWLRGREKQRKWWNPLRYLIGRWYKTYVMDILSYCPYCGQKLSEPIGKLQK